MYIFYYFLLSFNIVGYGYLLSKFLSIETKNFGILGLFGISLLILISYLSSIFFRHGYFFNSIIFIFGIILFFYFIINTKIIISDIVIYFSVFLILLIFILAGKNHDDFSYYHFPYSMIISEFSHPIGLGHLNNGFRNPSSIFFLNSLFYLPKIDYYLFHISSAFFLGFSNIILIKKIFNEQYFNKINLINLLSLISILFINIFFYRMAEYGTDRSAQILIILVIIFSLIILNEKTDQKQITINNLFVIFILISLALSIKPIFLLYSPLILILLFSKNIKSLFKEIIFSKTVVYCLIFVSFYFFYNLTNSGCLVYPATFTCLEFLSWTVDIDYVKSVNIWYELWSKGGASPNFVVEDRLHYISGFNWLPRWIEIYFFNKVSDFLLGLATLSLIIFLFFFKGTTLNKKFNYFFIYLFLFLIFIEWFLKHPTLRYGGYHVIALLIFIPLSIYLSKKKITYEQFKKKSIILILIGITVFYARNIKRLYQEYTNYEYNPLVNTNYKFTEAKDFYFRYNSIIKDKIDNYDKKEFFGKTITIIKKDEN
tara:strand:- start:9171 stop:10796 length:1626 start_codon:yes stop_codon:yes gene_type:complete